ncbi:hypothetical protein IEO21_07260 [Rhodonia placenta]|uniref:F-box domain-containing protein n=1 Tax=Rhodonia placenta TaxID=104341 RepID=A0A8H7NYV0_9APHY|nr:hypothetical protein IEO21_07260 [Postia placenta]
MSLTPLPVEVWLLIIDELGATREYGALKACVDASHGEVQERAKKHIPPKMIFKKIEDVAGINVGRKLRWEGPNQACIEGGGHGGGERFPIPHLATFASRLAGQWPNLKTVKIERAEWRVQDLDLQSIFVDLSCFDSITELHLHGVTFPTIVTFLRLVCGLPQLRELDVCDVEIVKTAIDASTLSMLRMVSLPWRGRSCEQPATVATRSAGLLPLAATIMDRVSIAQAISYSRTSPWSGITLLELGDVIFPAAVTFARLLCALPVLGTLDIQGPCTFSRHGFDPQDVPLLSGMLPRLEISKPSVNIAINTLVLRAGQSLRWINLDPIAEENPLLYSAMPPEVAQSLAHRLCIWGNTHLLVLRYSVDVINQHESYVAPIVERLNQVASASISDIHLAFHIANEVFLPKLCDSLAQIDTALCGTVLYSARLVKISLCGVASSKQIAKAKVRSCLPKLDSRGILRCAPPWLAYYYVDIYISIIASFANDSSDRICIKIKPIRSLLSNVVVSRRHMFSLQEQRVHSQKSKHRDRHHAQDREGVPAMLEGLGTVHTERDNEKDGNSISIPHLGASSFTLVR